MTGLLHFAAKIKFVPVLKSQPAAMQEKAKGGKGERKKDHYFDMEQNLQKKPQNFGCWIPVCMKIKRLLIKNCI